MFLLYHCYHSNQNNLSSQFLTKNVMIKKYKTTILPVVLHECETRSLILREKHCLRAYENRVVRIFRP